jgi:hypothetical protein
MDEDGDLKNGIGIEMDEFDLVVIKESVEEIAGEEVESALNEGGKHHDFIHIGCRKIFTGDKVLLQHDVVWEKVVRNKFANLTFICDGRLEQVRVQGGHGWEEVLLRQGIKASEERRRRSQ